MWRADYKTFCGSQRDTVAKKQHSEWSYGHLTAPILHSITMAASATTAASHSLRPLCQSQFPKCPHLFSQSQFRPRLLHSHTQRFTIRATSAVVVDSVKFSFSFSIFNAKFTLSFKFSLSELSSFHSIKLLIMIIILLIFRLVYPFC